MSIDETTFEPMLKLEPELTDEELIALADQAEQGTPTSSSPIKREVTHTTTQIVVKKQKLDNDLDGGSGDPTADLFRWFGRARNYQIAYTDINPEKDVELSVRAIDAQVLANIKKKSKAFDKTHNITVKCKYKQSFATGIWELQILTPFMTMAWPKMSDLGNIHAEKFAPPEGKMFQASRQFDLTDLRFSQSICNNEGKNPYAVAYYEFVNGVVKRLADDIIKNEAVCVKYKKEAKDKVTAGRAQGQYKDMSDEEALKYVFFEQFFSSPIKTNTKGDKVQHINVKLFRLWTKEEREAITNTVHEEVGAYMAHKWAQIEQDLKDEMGKSEREKVTQAQLRDMHVSLLMQEESIKYFNPPVCDEVKEYLRTKPELRGWTINQLPVYVTKTADEVKSTWKDDPTPFKQVSFQESTEMQNGDLAAVLFRVSLNETTPQNKASLSFTPEKMYWKKGNGGGGFVREVESEPFVIS